MRLACRKAKSVQSQSHKRRCACAHANRDPSECVYTSAHEHVYYLQLLGPHNSISAPTILQHNLLVCLSRSVGDSATTVTHSQSQSNLDRRLLCKQLGEIPQDSKNTATERKLAAFSAWKSISLSVMISLLLLFYIRLAH